MRQNVNSFAEFFSPKRQGGVWVFAMVAAFLPSVTAAPLAVSVSGQFGVAVTADSLAGPGDSWTISFDIDSSPVTANADALGFDAPFSDFSYLLNGSAVAVSPESIRLYTTTGGGLFTVFFGSETGFYNGQPIPEFTFSGNQVFLGTTSNPAILAGSYPVSDALYSDAVNYDDEGAKGTITILSSPITTTAPEPSPFVLWLMALALMLQVLRRRLIVTPIHFSIIGAKNEGSQTTCAS